MAEPTPYTADPKVYAGSINDFVVVADPAVPCGFLVALDGERMSITFHGEPPAADFARLLTRWRIAVQNGDILKPPAAPASSATGSHSVSSATLIPTSSGGFVTSGGTEMPVSTATVTTVSGGVVTSGGSATILP